VLSSSSGVGGEMVRRHLNYFKARWNYRKEYNSWLEERNVKHKKNSAITGNFLWLEFMKQKTGEAQWHPY